MAAGQVGKGDDSSAGLDTGAKSSADKPLPPAAKRKQKSVGGAAVRKTEPGSMAGGGRYTPPVPAASKGPSPRWVPVLMFGLWVLGLALILLNYMGLLPGSGDGGNGLYLVGGLVAILGGIVTATQYR